MSDTSVTLRELAARLGLGKSTVQRALAGSTRVSAATRQRVQSLARELGFQRNTYFSALSAQHHKHGQRSLLIHYIHEKRRKGSTLGTGINLIEQLQAHGLELGLDVQLPDHEEFEDPERLVRTLYQRGSCGFIVSHCQPHVHDTVLRFNRLPILACQWMENFPTHTLRFSTTGLVRMCWDHLWEAGYRRIGCALLKHDPTLQDDRDREAAALQLLRENLPPEDRIPPLCCELHDSDAYIDWLRRYEPEAVIGFRTGLWFLQRTAGYGHLPFVTLHAGDSPVDKHIPGSMQSKELLARETIRKLDDMIRHGEVGVPLHAVHTVIPPVWHEGEGFPRKGG